MIIGLSLVISLVTAAALCCLLLHFLVHYDAPPPCLLHHILISIFHGHVIANSLSSPKVNFYIGTKPRRSQRGNRNYSKTAWPSNIWTDIRICCDLLHLANQRDGIFLEEHQNTLIMGGRKGVVWQGVELMAWQQIEIKFECNNYSNRNYSSNKKYKCILSIKINIIELESLIIDLNINVKLNKSESID